MSTLTTKRLLHVEDDPMQQRVLLHYLKSMEEFRFETTAVKCEDEALAAFRTGGFDLVVLDYQLAQGDGLHLLRCLRQLDPVIPIIGISGVATSKVAAELVEAGADDYFDKRDLTGAKLARGVRDSLRRADTVRRHLPGPISGIRGQMVESLLVLCEFFVSRVGTELVQKLDTFAAEARRAKLGAADLEEFHRSVCRRLETTGRFAPVPAQLVLRPLMLDLLVRVVGDPDGTSP